MIAIAIKKEDVNSPIAPLFGHAKYFALVDDAKNVKVRRNETSNGMRTVQWVSEQGVKVLIANHIGEKPFHALSGKGVKVYFAGKDRLLVSDLLQKFDAGELEEVNAVNYMDLLGEEEGAQAHSHESGALWQEEKPSQKGHHCCQKEGHSHGENETCCHGEHHDHDHHDGKKCCHGEDHAHEHTHGHAHGKCCSKHA